MTNDKRLTDHDLLIRLDQRVSDLQIAVKDIKDNTISRVESLEKTKADRIDLDKIQKNLDDNIEFRVRSLETDRVTQREHTQVLNQISDLQKISISPEKQRTLEDASAALKNGQIKIFTWAAALAFLISLLVSLVLPFIKK